MFVIPCFELKYGLECPNDKNELKHKSQEGIIRPFHNAVSIFLEFFDIQNFWIFYLFHI